MYSFILQLINITILESWSTQYPVHDVCCGGFDHESMPSMYPLPTFPHPHTHLINEYTYVGCIIDNDPVL